MYFLSGIFLPKKRKKCPQPYLVRLRAIMTNNKLQDEMTYQLTMIQADRLLKSRIISEEVHQQFKEKMLEKYQPFISRLST